MRSLLFLAFARQSWQNMQMQRKCPIYNFENDLCPARGRCLYQDWNANLAAWAGPTQLGSSIRKCVYAIIGSILIYWLTAKFFLKWYFRSFSCTIAFHERKRNLFYLYFCEQCMISSSYGQVYMESIRSINCNANATTTHRIFTQKKRILFNKLRALIKDIIEMSTLIDLNKSIEQSLL